MYSRIKMLKRERGSDRAEERDRQREVVNNWSKGGANRLMK